MTEQTDDLLRVLIRVTGRVAVSPDELRELVTGGKAESKTTRAYNLCDGKRSQSEIATQVGMDRGNFSKALARWERLGIAFRVGECPLHLYPLSAEP
jgi:hypothetical protein